MDVLYLAIGVLFFVLSIVCVRRVFPQVRT